MKYNISAIGFDIDGTLYPAWRFNIKIMPFILSNFKFMTAFNKARKDIRIYQEKNPNKRIDDFFNFQAELIAGYLKKESQKVKTFLEEEIYGSWKYKFKHVKPYKFAKEAIIEFKNKGLKIGLLSDFLPKQKNDVWGILPYCDAAIGSEQTGALKPSVIPFQALAKALNEPCKNILYVGNNLKYDVVGAKNAGMYTACIHRPVLNLFTKKNVNPDIYFSNYRQLLKFVL